MFSRPLSRAEVRDIDRRAMHDYGLPGLILMENAGRGAADLLRTLGVSGRVVLCAGQGNNGGDAFVMARHLELRGIDCLVILCGAAEALAGDAAVNYCVLRAAGRAGLALGATPDLARLAAELARAEWIVDALLGTGAQGSVRDPLRGVIETINRAGKKTLAVDLPSGLDCDTGRPLGICVRADQTATFVAPKLGFAAEGAAAWTGQVHVVDIGAPLALLREAFAAPPRTE